MTGVSLAVRGFRSNPQTSISFILVLDFQEMGGKPVTPVTEHTDHTDSTRIERAPCSIWCGAECRLEDSDDLERRSR